MRKVIFLAAAGALLMAGGRAWAAPSFETPVAPFSAAPRLGAPVMTSGGLGVVTGDMGSTGIVTVPGQAGQGLLLNNGNGTSTLLDPNGPEQTVATPQ
jgi:hypothetical protein